MPRDFDPFTLRLFIAVCDERSIAGAAARHAIVASAVSKRVAAIERDIGAPLLNRGRRGITPTAAGLELLRQARDVLAVMERMHAELTEFGSGVQGSVRVVASVSVLAERLPDDIATFLARHDAVRVSLDERGGPDIVRMVREGTADVGVLWDAADLAGLQALAYRSDHLCVALPPSHRLARRPRLRFVETLDEISIGVAAGGMVDVLLRRQAALAGRTQVHRIQVSSISAACRIVAAGLGIAILPREATAPFVAASGLAMVPLAERWAQRRFVACVRAQPALSASARLLAEHLRDAAAAPQRPRAAMKAR